MFLGIEPSKSFKESLAFQEHRRISKEGFSLSCVINDINDFVNGNHLQDFSEDDLEYEEVSELIHKAESLNNEQIFSSHVISDVKSFFINFRKTRIGCMLRFLSNLMEEVNVSRLQFCKHREFILKFLKNYNCAIIVKTTKPNGPVFFFVGNTC
jgi:hypothetical protein